MHAQHCVSFFTDMSIFKMKVFSRHSADATNANVCANTSHIKIYIALLMLFFLKSVSNLIDLCIVQLSDNKLVYSYCKEE